MGNAEQMNLCIDIGLAPAILINEPDYRMIAV
jgi:hypothetical protein